MGTGMGAGAGAGGTTGDSPGSRGMGRTRGDSDYPGFVQTIPGKPTSPWLDWMDDALLFPALSGDMSADVVVVGGGIAGVLTAWLLKDNGLGVILLEGGRLCQNATGHTTAKVSIQHGLIYRHLVDKFSPAEARQYAEANQAGMDLILTLARVKRISCGLERASSYVTCSPNDAKSLELLKGEVDAAKSIGLQVSLEEHPPAPYDAGYGVKFYDQAMFDPVRFLIPLAREISGEGCAVYEHTRVLKISRVDGGQCAVETATGTVRTGRVVIATNYPILDEGHYFSKLYPKRSYAMAAYVGGMGDDGRQGVEGSGGVLPASIINGLYYHVGDDFRSWRDVVVPVGRETGSGAGGQGGHGGRGRLALFGGMRHKAGQAKDEAAKYLELLHHGMEQFPELSVAYHWSTQDYMTPDGIPFIGKSPGGEGIYIACGFGGWGMTNGALSALMLKDLIVTGGSVWEELFSPARVKPGAALKRFVEENVNVAGKVVGSVVGHMKGKTGGAEPELEPGEGAVLNVTGERRDKDDDERKLVGICRDDKGLLHRVSPVCTHLGCTCKWNTGELTWDCPCHGSRFAPDGSVIYGPAVHPLDKSPRK